jgi:formylglycine-generating enzyme required for sulfatase activity
MKRNRIILVALAAVLSLWGFGCGTSEALSSAPIGLTMPIPLVEIPAGEFLMGSPETEEERGRKEIQHLVRITYSFWMGKTVVTQKQWLKVMGTTTRQQAGDATIMPCDNEGDTYPMYFINWFEAMAFCARLTEREREAGRLPAGYEYRLPTEAEWEYACRAGSTTRFAYGDTEADLDAMGWYKGNMQIGFRSSYVSGVHLVGTKLPNDWGLYDMHGNVVEWCFDWRGDYSAEEATDPFGPLTGSSRVSRGGCWYLPSYLCRSATRGMSTPDMRSSSTGFRVVLAPPIPTEVPQAP